MDVTRPKCAKALLYVSVGLNVVLGIVYITRPAGDGSGSGGAAVSEVGQRVPEGGPPVGVNHQRRSSGPPASVETKAGAEEMPRLPLSVIAGSIGRVISPDGKRLSPAAVDIFKISESEQTAVSERVGEIMDRILAAEVAAIKLTEREDGDEYLVLEPDENLKAAMERELEITLTQILGESRGERVAELAAAQNVLGLESKPINLYLEGEPGSYVFVVERPGAPKYNYDQIPERFAHLLDKEGWDKLLEESWRNPFEN